ncbi:uncharacterized protein LOC123012566 [Tribolium madens]|uniref:uncharacterized protein LOC123012566 n=1 Tax=Tribolium madens TaxID=41895 RepID=UPI001CF759ED|nr:uncharacterized protein LOC123012566 [Tribolium madens]
MCENICTFREFCFLTFGTFGPQTPAQTLRRIRETCFCYYYVEMCFECERKKGWKPFLPRGFGKREKNPRPRFTNLGVIMRGLEDRTSEYEANVEFIKDLGIAIEPLNRQCFNPFISPDEIKECRQPQIDTVVIYHRKLFSQFRFGSAKSKVRFLKELEKIREEREPKKEGKSGDFKDKTDREGNEEKCIEMNEKKSEKDVEMDGEKKSQKVHEVKHENSEINNPAVNHLEENSEKIHELNLGKIHELNVGKIHELNVGINNSDKVHEIYPEQDVEMNEKNSEDVDAINLKDIEMTEIFFEKYDGTNFGNTFINPEKVVQSNNPENIHKTNLT